MKSINLSLKLVYFSVFFSFNFLLIYIFSPEDYHRRLEIERSDHRVSDSRALQMLQEMKEKGKVAQQLREEKIRSGVAYKPVHFLATIIYCT